MLELKSLPLELKDLNKEKGTATIAHAVYDNLDRVRDIASKGMFTKSWKEKKMANGGYDIAFYRNHDEEQAPGKVINVFEDNANAYTEVKMGTHTLGRDTLIEMDEGIARNASFGFYTLKSQPIEIKGGRNARKLLEVEHAETSVLTKLGANGKAGVIKVNKSFDGLILDIKSLTQPEQDFVKSMIGDHMDTLTKLSQFADGLDPKSDLYTTAHYWLGRVNDLVQDMKYQTKWNGPKEDLDRVGIKAHLEKLQKFVRNTKASDGSILEAEAEIKSLESLLEISNTADTSRDVDKPAASVDEVKALSDELEFLLFKHF